ncbi:MAG: hypothetical protein ABUR63_00370 [Verrucomicrobiota bacterium]
MTLLERIVSLLPKPRVIYDREGGSPYLSRWYLLGNRFDTTGIRIGRSWLPISLYLHKFHRSDDDGALHNHPWSWSVAMILSGGYREERRVGDQVVVRYLLPFSINIIRGADYHRVDLPGSESWSLFLAGPRVSTWHFWDRNTKMRAHWRAFVEWRRGQRQDAGWESDRREAA